MTFSAVPRPAALRHSINLLHLFALSQRGVYWVTRAKDSMAYTVRLRSDSWILQ